MYPNELTLVETQNQQAGVFLKMADYQQMLKALEVLKSMVVSEMEQALPLDVPVKVDVGIGNSWYEAH